MAAESTTAIGRNIQFGTFTEIPRTGSAAFDAAVVLFPRDVPVPPDPPEPPPVPPVQFLMPIGEFPVAEGLL
jgi:hypothetical protein